MKSLQWGVARRVSLQLILLLAQRRVLAVPAASAKCVGVTPCIATWMVVTEEASHFVVSAMRCLQEARSSVFGSGSAVSRLWRLFMMVGSIYWCRTPMYHQCSYSSRQLQLFQLVLGWSRHPPTSRTFGGRDCLLLVSLLTSARMQDDCVRVLYRFDMKKVLSTAETRQTVAWRNVVAARSVRSGS